MLTVASRTPSGRRAARSVAPGAPSAGGHSDPSLPSLAPVLVPCFGSASPTLRRSPPVSCSRAFYVTRPRPGQSPTPGALVDSVLALPDGGLVPSDEWNPLADTPPTGRKPASLRVNGKSWSVKTWKELLLVVIELVHGEHPDRYVELFEHEAFHGRKRSMFARAPEFLRSPVVIPGGFAEANVSAETVVRPRGCLQTPVLLRARPHPAWTSSRAPGIPATDPDPTRNPGNPLLARSGAAARSRRTSVHKHPLRAKILSRFGYDLADAAYSMTRE